MKMREKLADMLAHNDECGPGPVSRGEYLADADEILRLLGHDPIEIDFEMVERAARAIHDYVQEALGLDEKPISPEAHEMARCALDAALNQGAQRHE